MLNNSPNKPKIVPEKIATPVLSSNNSLKSTCGSDNSSFSRNEIDYNLIILLYPSSLSANKGNKPIKSPYLKLI